MTRAIRKHIPDGVKLIAVLARFGLKLEQVQFDHCPPLALRPIDPDTGDTIPAANDPVFIQMLTIEEHRDKTFGKSKATVADGDIHRIAKAKRLSAGQEEFRRRMLTAERPNVPAKKKASIPSRPFPRRSRPARAAAELEARVMAVAVATVKEKV